MFLTSEPPHTGAAGAIVLQRLFAGHPPDRLLVVTNNLPPANVSRLECRYAHVPLRVDRLNRTRFWSWRTAARVLGGAALLRPSRVDAALSGFRPDVVVTLMQDSWYYDYAARYARARDLPLVLIIHDLPDGFEPVATWLCGWQLRRDGAVYRQAACRLCISEPMRDHFKEIFGADGDVLPPPRADEPIAQPPEFCARLKQTGRLTLGYAGGLHYGYGEQLLALLPVLRETGTRLEYFGPQPAGAVTALGLATDVIRFNGYAPVPGDAWRTLLARCDVILQPYLNPPGPHELQYRTHFPSKLGDCLSLGLPLLVTGPAFANGVVWCRDQGDIARLITDPAPAAFKAALTQLRDSPELRVSLATRAQAAAHAFAAPPLRAHLLQLLAAAAHV